MFAARSPQWQEVRVSDGRDNGGFDLALDSRGRGHVTWDIWDNQDTVWYANESSGWTDVRVDTNQTSYWWDDRRDPSIAIDGTDQAHIVWSDARNTPQLDFPPRIEGWHASTADGFVNSELVLPDDATPIDGIWYPQIAFDAAGGLHAVFGGFSYSGYKSLYYANSTDWSRAVQVTNVLQTTTGRMVFATLAQEASA